MNNYHIYEVIGRGQHSTVYKGRKKKTIIYYAIKSVEKSQKPRVLQEVRTMHALDHNNLLKFYAWYETTNHLWLILEYCSGGDLMSLLKQDLRLPESSIHDFGRDLLVALQYLHSHAIMYCDLKPSNILMDENGRLKLGGFGLSRRLAEINAEGPGGAGLPQAKRGTPSYMAPELFSDDGPHSTASDIWSLGCVLYECATGRPPFASSSLTQLVHDILHVEPPPVPSASPEFQDLISRMLEKNPAERLGWETIIDHPFWRFRLNTREMPDEPMLRAFVARHGLALAAATEAPHAAAARGAGLRASVDVLRLSRIVRSNLVRETEEAEGTDYDRGGAQQPRAQPGDVRIVNADAELDFRERSNAAGGGSGSGDHGQENVAPGGAPEAVGARKGLGDGAGPGPAGRTESAEGPTWGDTDPPDARGSAGAGGAGSGAVWGSEAAAGGGAGRAPTPSHPSAAGSGRLPPSSADDTVPRPSLTPQIGANPRPAVQGPVALTGAKPTTTSSLLSASHASGARAAAAAAAAAAEAPSSAPGAPLRLDDLMWHATDAAVKPIVGNRRIERAEEYKWDAAALPFRAAGLQEMLAMSAPQLEAFLGGILRAVTGPLNMSDKCNVLAYFETLCGDTGAANVLINSSLMQAFVRLLKSAKHDRLRSQLASCLGLLLRHATYISEELARTGLLDVLAECLRDKSESVRRRATATLGELLFYIATQVQDSLQPGASDASVWTVPPAVLAALVRLLRPGEDEVQQHYVVKALENVASQPGEWGLKFASAENLVSLVQIYHGSKNEYLRSTALSTAARLLKRAPGLAGPLADRIGTKPFQLGLGEQHNPKVQAAAASVLAVLLAAPEVSARVKAALQEDRSLVSALAALADSPQPVLQAKGLVALGLLCRQGPRFLAAVCSSSRLLEKLDKLGKDKDPYLVQVLAALRAELGGLLASYVASVGDDFSRQLSSRGGRTGSAGPAGPGPTTSAPAAKLSQYFGLVPALLAAPALRGDALTPDLVRGLASLLTLTSAARFAAGGAPAATPQAAQQSAALRPDLLRALEALGETVWGGGGGGASPAAPNLAAIVFSDLVPALAQVAGDRQEPGDSRFSCSKVLADLVLGAAAAATPGDDGAGGITTGHSTLPAEALDRAFRDHVLPVVPALLHDTSVEVLPLHGLKLLVAVLELAPPRWVTEAAALRLEARLVSFLSLESANNNVHNLRVVRALIAGGGMSLEDVASLDAATKVEAVLSYAHENEVEPFLEPVLDLSLALLRAGEAAAPAVRAAALSPLMPGLPLFADLLRYPELPVAALAAQCLSGLCQAFPSEAAPAVLSPEFLSLAVEVLGGEQGFSHSSVQAPLLQAFCHVARHPDSWHPGLRLGPEEAGALARTARALAASPAADREVVGPAGELVERLRQAGHF